MMNEKGFRVPRWRADRTHRALRTEILKSLEPILFGPLSRGEEAVRTFESTFSKTVEANHAVAVHSATAGLSLALKACDVGPGDQVITVGNSDISTTAAISHCGGVPVLCDVLETDFTINPSLVEPLVTERTKAILPVDLYGHPADTFRLREIATKYDLKIVEDAALALGGSDYGHPVGAFADVTVFSFAPLKILGSLGNGGMVTANDQEIARRVRLLCGYGKSLDSQADTPGHQMHIAEGYNVPLDPLQAALLTIKLPYLKEWTEKRRAIANAYAQGLQSLGVTLPRFRQDSSPTFRSYAVRVKDQPSVYEGLQRAGIDAVLHYVPTIFRQPVYASKLLGADNLPVTDRLAQEVVCLPVIVELGEEDIQFVVEVMRDLCKV